MIRRLLDPLQTRFKASLAAVSLVLVLGVGAADYLTRYYLSLGLFYVVPISLLAWYVSRKAGVTSALFSALVWYSVNSVFAPPQVGQAILIWNTAVRLGFFILISSLLSSLKEAYDHQKYLARTDPHTGLLNSRAFKEEASIELMRAIRNKYEVTALYLDLDNFKVFNDLRGHAAGDSLLKDVGLALRSSLRSIDIVGRLGGDEFAVILSGTSQSQAQAAASRLQAAVLGISSSQDPAVTVTIGAVTSDGYEDIESLIRRADHMMYQGKTSMKGSVNLGSKE